MDRSILELCFSMPIAPTTILLCVVSAYWLFVIIGAVGVDFIDPDLELNADLDIGTDYSLTDWGLIGLRFFNLGEVPLMVWLTALALVAWFISVSFDRNVMNPSAMDSLAISLRNFAIGAFGAKFLTHPLRGKLIHKEPNTAKELIGTQCVVTTSECTPEFGQVECPVSDGAPLLLSARTAGESIRKGTIVEIVEYLAEPRTYVVRDVKSQHA